MAWRCSADSNQALISNMSAAGIISTPAVSAAMNAVDRVNFVSGSPYQDAPQSIGYDATISAPHMHAYVLERLVAQSSNPGATIMDVGCGSGYLCAVFSELAPSDAHIYGIDYIPELVSLSERNLNKQNPSYLADRRVQLRCGDGWRGISEAAPFDVIHVGAAAQSMPPALLQQLKVGGRMIIPVGVVDQELLEVDRITDIGPTKEQYTVKSIMGVRYVPLVKVKA